MRNQIINDKLTAEKASVKVGQDMYDKYVNISPNEPPNKFERKTKNLNLRNLHHNNHDLFHSHQIHMNYNHHNHNRLHRYIQDIH